mmetsp:Transcript_351/g.768  ORF Transcript_351/g.768 Transcript_351/m.768 type:complete len:154 (+) Transcript_351:76-537(+)
MCVLLPLALPPLHEVKLEQDARRKVMGKVLAHFKGPSGFLKLMGAVGNARNCFTGKEFEGDPLCQQAEQVLKQFNEYASYGQDEQAGIAMKRKDLIMFADPDAERPKYHCPDCRRPIEQNEKLCRVCGAKMPKTGLEPTPAEEIMPDGTRAPV